MKKAEKDELREEYSRADFGAMTRGKYAARCKDASNVVVLTPEVAAAFPNTQAVNDALRGLIDLAKATGLSQPKPLRKRAAAKTA